MTCPLSRRSWGGTRDEPKNVCVGGYKNTSENIKKRIGEQHNKIPNLILAVITPHIGSCNFVVRLGSQHIKCQRLCHPRTKHGPVQEGGVNLLAQLADCAADDLSHYDVTSEPVREISMAAKR